MSFYVTKQIKSRETHRKSPGQNPLITQFMGLVSAYFPVPKKSTKKSMVITVFTKKLKISIAIFRMALHPSSHGPFRHGKLRT